MTFTHAEGLLVLDKPAGMTSRDAVNRVQRWLPRGTRIGHTGTLDPLATGVLVLCLGSATRLAEYVQRMRKTYVSTFLLGARSDTDDADGTVAAVPGAAAVPEEELRRCLEELVGEIEQTPPAYSAAKVAGKRAHALARQGHEVDLAPRRVRIYGIDILSYSWPTLQVEVRCGKGVYIRSLARDLGERLGCGGLVHALRRTRVGPFRVEEAIPLDTPPGQALARLRPAALALAELPAVVLPADEAARLGNGQQVPCPTLPPGLAGPGEVAVHEEGGRLVGVAGLDPASKQLRPLKILR